LADHLVARYGGEARELIAMIVDEPELGRPLVWNLPYVGAEAGLRRRWRRPMRHPPSRW